MTDSLNVLVVQTHPHAADLAVEALEAAGHRVHRCHEEEATRFPCRGALDASACPLDAPVDVAFVARLRIQPHPTELEVGVTCAIRAGLPIVEQGTDLLDPFAPFVTTRATSAAVVPQACADAVDAGRGPLRRAIIGRISALLGAAGIAASAVDCTIDGGPVELVIHLDLPAPVGQGVEHALAVRVLDAVRSTGHTYGRINVSVSPAPSTP
jgi:hypothetical protein